MSLPTNFGSIKGSDLGSLNPPMSENDLETKERTLEEQLEYLDRLQKQQEALKNQEEMPGVESQAEMPSFDLSQLNIPINPIFDDNFDGMAPLINIGKLVLGPAAVKFRALGPSMGILGAFLGMTNQDLLPGFIGLGITAASAFLLKNQVQNISLRNTEQKSTLGWLASKTMIAAKVGLTAYSLASGVGMLSSVYGAYRAAGLLSTAVSIGSGLYSLYSSENQAIESDASESYIGSMMKRVGKVGAIAYGTIAGLGSTLGLGNLPGIIQAGDAISKLSSYAPVAFGSSLFQGFTTFIAQKPIEIALSLGLMLGTQLLMWKVTGTAFQTLNAELEKINNSNKYGPTLERLQAIGQEEYHQIITRETGMDYEKIKDAFEPLRSRNANYPENAAKPVIARLMLLNQEIYAEGGAMHQYAELLKSNNLEAAHEFLNKELRPKLMIIVYLKHCLVSPTRPQFGNIIGNPGSQEYFSYVSHLVGMPIKLPLQQIDPNKVQEEAHMILMKENELQQQFYIYKMMQEQAMLKEQAEQLLKNKK